MERLECLNEAVGGSGKTVFKAWDDRMDKSKVRENILYKAHPTILFSLAVM